MSHLNLGQKPLDAPPAERHCNTGVSSFSIQRVNEVSDDGNGGEVRLTCREWQFPGLGTRLCVEARLWLSDNREINNNAELLEIGNLLDELRSECQNSALDSTHSQSPINVLQVCNEAIVLVRFSNCIYSVCAEFQLLNFIHSKLWVWWEWSVRWKARSSQISYGISTSKF